MKWTVMTGSVLAAALAATQAAIVAQGLPSERPAQQPAPSSNAATVIANGFASKITWDEASGGRTSADNLTAAAFPSATRVVAGGQDDAASQESEATEIVRTLNVTRPVIETTPEGLRVIRYETTQQTVTGTQAPQVAYGQLSSTNANPLTGYLGGQVHQFDQREMELEAKARGLVQRFAQTPATEQQGVREQLREVTESHFDYRIEKRKEEITQLESRLAKIKQDIERRQELRDEIIDKRMADLLQEGSELDWDPRSQKDAPRFGVNRTPSVPGVYSLGTNQPYGTSPTPNLLSRTALNDARYPANNPYSTRPLTPSASLPAAASSGLPATAPNGPLPPTSTLRYPAPVVFQDDTRTPAGWASSVKLILDLRGRLGDMDDRIKTPQVEREIERLKVELEMSEEALQVAFRLLQQELQDKEREVEIKMTQLARHQRLFESGAVDQTSFGELEVEVNKVRSELKRLMSITELAAKALEKLDNRDADEREEEGDELFEEEKEEEAIDEAEPADPTETQQDIDGLFSR